MHTPQLYGKQKLTSISTQNQLVENSYPSSHSHRHHRWSSQHDLTRAPSQIIIRRIQRPLLTRLPIAMEIPRRSNKLVICTTVVLLSAAAFSCCIAAEFKKVKVESVKLDGSLCSLPKSSSFGLGIAALVCLSVAQIIGTTRGGTRFCSTQSLARFLPTLLLLPCWVIYVVASILLATATSMSGGQPYGKGWMDGDCYVVHDGVYTGAGILVVSVTLLILAFNFTEDEDVGKSRRRSGSQLETGNGSCHEGSTS